MQMRNCRVAVAGSNTWRVLVISRRDFSTSRAVTISVSARGVGCMPLEVRTNSGSLSWLRSLLSQMLTVGCFWPICSAARVTLRVS